MFLLLLPYSKPPIVKLDAKSLGTLTQCQKLSLSTNAIEKMVPLTGMSKLKILSLGRNNIKKIEKLDDVAESLEQLWLSYNQITSLDGLASLTKLTTLYCSNNLIKAFSELDKLKSNELLKDVLFLGNPMYDEVGGDKEKAKIETLKRLPQLSGSFVTPADREAALQA
ncbi:hypothetical protein THAOC_05923 [Thalassiosira oceanica]|uniref:Dynein axonemal light chain 1 n=1 Tax=Thalassiosira oceanica TaxID=159749 RepID=K0T5Y3_THAOC|nr:hypothetical protein THAOC_05923 [Thalassiosira oceanica]|eukprot:EJK72539.1 hypothetical protein THAOC_05923 [Thalassiosira oceanica]